MCEIQDFNAGLAKLAAEKAAPAIVHDPDLAVILRHLQDIEGSLANIRGRLSCRGSCPWGKKA
jgi:hypothetical protein